MPEDERLKAYEANGHSWPPAETFKSWPPVPNGPETEAYAKSRDAIEAWIRRLDDSQRKWSEWTTLVQSRIMPSFTEVGFRKTRAPDDVFQRLNDSYYKGLEALQKVEDDKSRNKELLRGVSPENAPWFIRQQRLNDQVMSECKPLLEEWSGVDLVEGQAYGVRAYRNGSTLINHVDRSETHVISFILHIASDVDEPWPIQIEDHDGNVHSVPLTPGDMLYYESSKQYHARFSPMKGRHYGSVFVHYYPTAAWNWTNMDMTTAVPMDWTLPPERVRDPARRAALLAAPEPPMIHWYNAYWLQKGWNLDDAPPYPVNLDKPVQNICDIPGMCGNATAVAATGGTEEL
eukprot:scaffold1087_cov198-Pinguiococcus_pyrenoidosus.AAC.12